MNSTINSNQSLLFNISSNPPEYLQKFKAACIVISVSISLQKCVASKKIKSDPQFSYIAPHPPCNILPSSSFYIETLAPPNTENAPVLPSIPSVNTSGLNPEFRKLTDIVKKKDSKGLGDFGGMVRVVRFLETDTKEGINESELRKRQMSFGSNANKKPSPKLLITLAVESFISNSLCRILILCSILFMVFGIIEHGANDWSQGGSFIIVLFFSRGLLLPLLRFWTERQLYKMQSSCVKIDVVRNGMRKQVWTDDLVVGDVVYLKVGDQVPTDGLCIDGHSLQVDESSTSGKTGCVIVNSVHNPFLLHGSKVVNGSSKMLVTSVGIYTDWGDKTPMQARLSELTLSLKKVGVIVALLILLVSITRCFNGETKHEYSGAHRELHIAKFLLEIILRSISTLILVDPDLELAFGRVLVNSLIRMRTSQLKFQNHVSFETMGLVTVICTNEASALTLTEMTVTKCWIGDVEDSSRITDPDLLELFHQGVALNTTCKEKEHNTNSESLVGCSYSPTEKAIRSWAVQFLGMKIDILDQSYTHPHVDSHLHQKGAANMVLKMCSSYYQPTGEMKEMTDERRLQFEGIIGAMMESSLQCIAFAHKKSESKESVSNEDSQNDLSLLGIIGMEFPCRSDAKNGIQSCKIAGVDIKMITSDDVNTATRIATGCGILEVEVNQHNAIGQVIEGAEFRGYTHEERLQKVDNIRVMARSSQQDKLLIVQCLKQKGHVVAVMADGTNDPSALKEADVALFMGREGSEVGKENSNIFILDNDFSSVATVTNRGRCFYTNIQKHIQYQLTIIIFSLVINLIASVTGKNIPQTIIQSLYLDLMGKLVTTVASVRPLEDHMHNPPVCQTDPLVTNVMWGNILAQAIYQIVAQSALLFVGCIDNEEMRSTLIFSTLVLCRVFCIFNSMTLPGKNVFQWIHKNALLLAVSSIIVIGQVLRTITGTVRLSLVQWGICFGIPCMTLLIGLIMKFVPVTKKPFLSCLRDSFTHVLNFF